jgi:hypothetical protein
MLTIQMFVRDATGVFKSKRRNRINFSGVKMRFSRSNSVGIKRETEGLNK